MDAAAEAFKLTDEAAGSHVGALAAQEPVAVQLGLGSARRWLLILASCGAKS